MTKHVDLKQQPSIWRHVDRLGLASRPYSIVAAPGLGLPLKRYLHVPAHGSHSASEMLAKIHAESGLAEPCPRLLTFWSDIEAGKPPLLSAGAIQIRDDTGPAGATDLAPKAYFKPRLIEGMGIRPAASAIARAIERGPKGPGSALRDEIVRRHEIEDVFYIACGLRPELEVETYHDVEFRRGDYDAREIWEIARGLAHHEEIARRAMACVAAAEGSPLTCNHISCDLWPLEGAGVTVVLTARDEPTARRLDHMAVIRQICELEGSLTKPSISLDEILIRPGMHPSVVAIKIAPRHGVVRHAVLVEEVDPEFAELL